MDKPVEYCTPDQGVHASFSELTKMRSVILASRDAGAQQRASLGLCVRVCLCVLKEGGMVAGGWGVVNLL